MELVAWEIKTPVGADSVCIHHERNHSSVYAFLSHAQCHRVCACTVWSIIIKQFGYILWMESSSSPLTWTYSLVISIDTKCVQPTNHAADSVES